MNPALLFFIGVILSLLISGISILILNSPLKSLLKTSGNSSESIRFWIRYVAILLVITPLLAFIFFGTPNDLPTDSLSLKFLKYSVGSALTGLFCALVAVGLQINKSCNGNLKT